MRYEIHVRMPEMTASLVARPYRYRQLEDQDQPFFLITDADLVDEFVIDGKGEIIALDLSLGLAGTLTASTTETANVLVVAPGAFLGPLSPQALASRRVLIVPCGSTPVSLDDLRAIFPVLEQTDAREQESRADAFFSAVEECATMTIKDRQRATSCTLWPDRVEGEWHQQAGVLAAGEQQIVPSGELSVLAGSISVFDQAMRLPLSGEVTLRGPVIVHAGYDAKLAGEQADLHRRLSGVSQSPVILGIDDGSIVSCVPAEKSSHSSETAGEIERLLEREDGYRIVWEVGFGINSELSLLPGNCGLNEVFGGRYGVFHLGLGLTPATRFALTFLCPDSTVTTDSGIRLAGPPARRVARVRSANCGCHLSSLQKEKNSWTSRLRLCASASMPIWTRASRTSTTRSRSRVTSSRTVTSTWPTTSGTTSRPSCDCAASAPSTRWPSATSPRRTRSRPRHGRTTRMTRCCTIGSSPRTWPRWA